MASTLLRALTPILLLATILPAPALEVDDGKIVSVAPESITVGKKHPKSYKVTPTTQVTSNGMSVAVTSLRVGMDAEVSFEGTVAVSISAKEASKIKGSKLDGSKLEGAKGKKSK